MTKKEMEKALAEYLDERWWIACHSISEQSTMINDAYYYGARKAIAQIGVWEQRPDGKHIISLDFSQDK